MFIYDDLDDDDSNYDYDYDCGDYYDEFEDMCGESALRKVTIKNPRIYPCPTCKVENRLTAKDVNLHYQCDDCADMIEGKIHRG